MRANANNNKSPDTDNKNKHPSDSTPPDQNVISKPETNHTSQQSTIKKIPRELLDAFKNDIEAFQKALQNESGKQILIPMKTIILCCRAILQIVENISKSSLNMEGANVNKDLKIVRENLSISLANLVEKSKLFASGNSDIDKRIMDIACSELCSNVENLDAVLNIDAQIESLNSDVFSNFKRK